MLTLAEHISLSPLPCFVGFVLLNKLPLQSGRNTQFRLCIILINLSCFRNTTSAIVSQQQKTANIYDIIIFKGLSFQNTLIRNYYALLFLLVPGQASQENLLVRQVLCTSRTSRAWQFHGPDQCYCGPL